MVLLGIFYGKGIVWIVSASIHSNHSTQCSTLWLMALSLAGLCYNLKRPRTLVICSFNERRLAFFLAAPVSPSKNP